MVIKIVCEGDPALGRPADGRWWAAATITTVGYGDVYPVTPVGRLVGGFTKVVGISSFALVTATIAQFLMGSE